MSKQEEEEETYVSWQKAEQEEVDELRKELAFRVDSDVMDKSGIEGKKRTAYLGRGKLLKWIEEVVTVKSVEINKNIIW